MAMSPNKIIGGVVLIAVSAVNIMAWGDPRAAILQPTNAFQNLGSISVTALLIGTGAYLLYRGIRPRTGKT